VDTGGKQRFISVDIPNAGDERLVENDGFQPASPTPKPRVEILELDTQRIWTDTGQRRSSILKELDPPKLSNIVVKQNAVLQLDNCARVSSRLCLPQQPARHPEMDVEKTAIEVDENLFAPSPYADYRCPKQAFRRYIEVIACDPVREELCCTNPLTGYQWSD